MDSVFRRIWVIMSAALGPWIRLGRSVRRMDWIRAEERDTPRTWPVDRKRYDTGGQLAFTTALDLYQDH